ncbi:conserved hypothetical protein [uncultured Desulfobacterium sp.]|uniref:Dinitrogenase iron-molybdenum cofactor biosynthesis domain-containing protein n=1 Tax=uncultured Desulfobacterium sp. TaxID=201089 RepID=A0A445MRJ1_9BACT|nr:conserved hypothetical protein [uncultured Desulfobacterium sp.]
MRIAIPVWDDKISPVLDTASKLLVVEMDGRKETTRFEIYLDERELTRRCVRIRRMEVNTLICGAVSRPFSRILTASGINIIPDIAGHPEAVLEAYLKGNLLRSGFMMPGCRGHGQKYGGNDVYKTCRRRRTQKGMGKTVSHYDSKERRT